MPNKLSFTVVAAAGMLLYAGNLVQAQTIASGTRVDVRTDETIDVRDQVDGRVFTGSVANDVMDQSGRVVIPRGSRAELEVRRIGSNEMSVDLDSVTVGQERYSVQATAPRTSREGVGENKRTGEYVGGGALLGTVLGAIAGGGKGAAIGAAAGAAAGAGTQTLTRGSSVHVPAESVLSFRLDRPLNVYADTGYERDGHHYHHYAGEDDRGSDRNSDRNYDRNGDRPRDDGR
jgi:hypothetical protein